MLVNSSSSANDTGVDICSTSNLGMFIMIGVSVVKTLLLLPLSTFILLMGHQQWRRRSFKAMSHSDIFMYHLASMEMVWGPGIGCFVCGTFSNSTVMLKVGMWFYIFSFYGEMFFHILTCVERYLAVVHPVTYVGLRNARGVGFRNMTIGGVWLLSFGMLGFHIDSTVNYDTPPVLCCLVFTVTVISFCSLSVLCALIRPGPGEGGGEKKRVDPLKRRAFVTITAILSVLWVWFVVYFVVTALRRSSVLSDDVWCTVSATVSLFHLPVSLVLPLLYLHRAGNLSYSWKKTEEK